MIHVAEDRSAAPPTQAAAPALDGPEAFRQLVELYSARLYRMAYRMTGQTQDAEDLVQETFLRAYRHRATFQARANLGTWLYRICLNASLDRLRQRRTGERSLDDPDPARAAAPVVSSAAGPERLALSGEVAGQVQTAMAELTPVERAAFAMRHYENLSIAEIGAALGLRDAAAKNTIFRGVRKLRRALAPLLERAR